jgi:ribosomal protein S18 acetylase RimI-like enzyme
MKILVREAIPEDAEAIAEVMITAMRSAFQGIVPEHCLEWPDSAAKWKKTLANGFEAGVFLDMALAENGLVVGYVMSGPTQSDDLYRGEVLQLSVLPDYQRQGIGSLLMRHAASRLATQGIHSLCVKVMQINPNRIFYERLGGQYVSEHPYDWDGVIFSECVYGWADTRELVESNRDRWRGDGEWVE